MLRYILLRLLQVIPVLLGTTFLIYWMVFAMPGDPIAAMFGDRQPSEAVLERLRAQYNLDQPFIVQYLLYLKGIFVGDFGMSFSGEPVREILARTFPVTIKLAIIAIAFELILAVLIGLYSGLRKGSWFDNINLIIALIFLAIPVFVLAFVAQYVFGLQLGGMVGNHMSQTLEPKLSHGIEHCPLTRNRIIEDDVEGRQAVGGDDQQMIFTHGIHVAHLAARQQGQGSNVGLI